MEHFQKRSALRASVLAAGALGAIAAPMSVAHAGDMPLKTPVIEQKGEFTAFIAGGAQWMGGDSIPFGNNFTNLTFLDLIFSIDPAVTPRIGWSAGGGFDYRFPGSAWHMNGQLRYGEARGSDSSSGSLTATSTDDNNNPTTTTASIADSVKLRETHWLVDFGGGYDFAPGRGKLQLNFGLRMAQLTARTDSIDSVSALFLDPAAASGDPTSTTESFSGNTTQKSTFLGIGPRIGAEGSVPFGPFSFDYSGNVAWLYGNSRIVSNSVTNLTVVSLPSGTGTNLNFVGLAGGSSYSTHAGVLNADVQVGISYWLTQNVKTTLSYRIDAYLNALSTYDINGHIQTLDRYYHGPEFALTARF